MQRLLNEAGTFQFAREESALVRKLRAGETVILYGDFAPKVLEQVREFFRTKTLGATGGYLPGTLILCAEHPTQNGLFESVSFPFAAHYTEEGAQSIEEMNMESVEGLTEQLKLVHYFSCKDLLGLENQAL